MPFFHNREFEYPARQLRRAAASTAANYRAACIARTDPNFIFKLDIVLEEADECDFWAADLLDSGLKNKELDWIADEAQQLTRIFGAARRTATSGGS